MTTSHKTKWREARMKLSSTKNESLQKHSFDKQNKYGGKTMKDDYAKQVMNHYKIQGETALKLLEIAQRLCPGTWVLQVLCNLEYKNGRHVLAWQVVVSNGDDNVTAINENLGAALAQLIYYLLNGSVFPLTGGGGQYVHPADCGWIKPQDDEAR